MLDIAWMFIASFVCFVIAVYLVWKRTRLGIAFIMVILQFAFAWYGYGRSHLPYILYDYIHIHESITNDTMAIALITAFILGFCVLVPFPDPADAIVSVRCELHSRQIREEGVRQVEDFGIFIAPLLTVLAAVAFMAIYVVKYKDPSD